MLCAPMWQGGILCGNMLPSIAHEMLQSLINFCRDLLGYFYCDKCNSV